MKTSAAHEKEEAIRRMLRTAYLEKETQGNEAGVLWQQNLMRDVRRIGPLNTQTKLLRVFDQLVWRFAAAACALVLMLGVYAGLHGWNPLAELDAQFFNNPAEFTVAQAFGVYESYE